MNALFKGFVALSMTVGAALPVLAHAQDTSTAQPFMTSQATQTVQVAGGWQPDAPDGLTRAQVYHQLVHAEKDGHLNYLDRTVYAHH
jgi:hypothetical protein